MSKSDQGDSLSAAGRRIAVWSRRAELARAQGQVDVERVAMMIVAAYQALLESGAEEPEVLVKANALRKRIESAENHRTMAAEHGLNDEAIDVTGEIQQLEKELVALVEQWKQTTSSDSKVQ